MLVLSVLLISQYVVKAQNDLSCQGITRGRKFVIAFTGNHEGDVTEIELFVLVVAFSDNPTTVTVSSKFQVNGIPFQETFEIQPRDFHRVSIPSELVLASTSERSNKVIEVDATSDVSVYGLNYAPFTTDAFLGIPVDHLGLNYVVMTYEESNQWPSLFAVVGVEDNTQVFATLTGTVTFNGDTYASGDILQFIVNQNEVVQIVSNSGVDFLGGSIIKSDKPVALFSGDLCASTPGSACDILSEQIVPVRSWGTTHLYTATGSSQGSSIYVVHAYYEDTVANIPGLNAVTLQPGEFFERELTGSGVITTSQPASVVQILRRIDRVSVDPSLIQIPTESQFGYIFGFSTPPKAGGDDDGFFNFINIIVKVNESSTVMLNGISIHTFDGISSHHIPDTDYEVFIIQVPKGEGAYFVEQNSFQSTSPISVLVYGYEDYESYGYSAGLSLPSDERLLSIKPFFLREVGGDQLIVTLPCVKAHIGQETSVYCRFHTNDVPIDVEGSFSGAYTVVCVAPIFPEVGFVTFELSIDEKETFPFRGNLYVAPQHVLPPKLSVKQTSSLYEDIIDATMSDDIISLTWNHDDFPNNETVDVSVMFATMDDNGDNVEWSDEVDIINDALNTGTANVRSKEVSDAANGIFTEDSSITMIVFSVKRSPFRRKRRFLGPLISFSARSAIRIFIPSVAILSTCLVWQPVLMYTKVTGLPPCPCTSDQARADVGNFVSDQNSQLSFYHPGASSCYRSLNNDRSGQQCCYGSDGNILVGPPGGGTADAVAPDGISFSTVGHFFLDVVPFFACCKFSDNCDTYYENRPSDDCSDYEPPIPTRGTGDPHFTSIDGKEFTFNGAGEFLLLKSSLFNVTFQARMEILPGTNASVYSAFVLTSNSSDQIQVQRSVSNETIVLINGLPFNLRQDGFVVHKQVRRGLHISLRTDLSEVYIRQQSGLSLSIRITNEMMSFILQLPNIFQNQVEGLLGNFNNDPDDDFMLPSGSFLSPNLTLEEIHYDFGLSWILDATTSLFTYLPPNDFSTFNKPSFKPTLTFPNPEQVSDDIKAICGESKFCLFDAISTGSTHFAEETLHDIVTFDSIKNHSVKIETCGFPGRLLNGVVNGSVYLVGHRLSVSCNEGFSLIGSPYLECDVNGSWSDVLPSCVSCPTPDTIPNVVVRGTDYSVGSVLTFSCVNDDYKLNGSLTVECQATGKWSSDFPECFQEVGFKYWIIAVAIGCCMTVVVVLLVLLTVFAKRKRENLV